MSSSLCAYHLEGGETLRYRIYGSGPVKMVLLHGLASNSECWRDLLPLFPADRYTLYLLDLLGSGESAKPKRADYSIRAHAARLLRFVEDLSLAGATVVGHSLGGAVVLVASVEALRAGKQGLIGSMIIIGAPGYLQRLPLIAEIFRSAIAGFLFVWLYAPDTWVKVGLRQAYYDHTLVDREHVARYLPCYRSRSAKRALVATCCSLVPDDQDAITVHYDKLRLPVLLLWGRHDRIVPLSQGERLKAAIAGSELEILERCGHNPQEEKPRETFAIIDGFVQKSEAQPRRTSEENLRMAEDNEDC